MTERSEFVYTCTACGEGETRRGNAPAKPTDRQLADSAVRVAGWRLGRNPQGVDVSYCPECAGTDPDYWEERRDCGQWVPDIATVTAAIATDEG